MKAAKTKHLFVIIFLTIITLALSLLTFNQAKAEDQATPNPETPTEGSFTYRNLTIKGEHEPIANKDYEISADYQSITINTEGWTLSGSIGVAGDTPEMLTVLINCNKIALDGLESQMDGCGLETIKDTEISLVGKDDSFFSHLTLNHNATIVGPKKIHVFNGALNAKKSLKLVNTTLEVWVGGALTTDNVTSYPLLRIGTDDEGDLTAINSRIVVSSEWNGGIAMCLSNNIYLDDNSELFAAGVTIAYMGRIPGQLKNALGSELYFKEFKDKDQANKATTETLIHEDTAVYYTKTINGTNDIVKTLYIKGSGSPTPPPTPEPDPSITAQTGDPLAIAIVVLIFLVIAGGVTCAIIYKRKHF